jgi:hypothetical protein
MIFLLITVLVKTAVAFIIFVCIKKYLEKIFCEKWLLFVLIKVSTVGLKNVTQLFKKIT